MGRTMRRLPPGRRQAARQLPVIQGSSWAACSASRAHPLGAGKAISPPRIAIPDARLAAEEGRGAAPPLEIKLDAPISDVAVGGGGRFLLLTQKDAHKLAIFDVNAAAIVKTISLPSSNALIATARKKP